MSLLKRRVKTVVGLVVFIPVLSVMPLVVSPYLLSLLFLVLAYITLAESFNIIGGYAGYANLGQGAFFGIGAYTFAILTVRGVPTAVALLCGILFPVVFAAAVSFPLFRLRGAYFAIAGFGLLNLMFYLATNLVWLTGGAGGLPFVTAAENNLVPAYYLAIVVSIASILFAYWLEYSKFGLGLISIREAESVAGIFGVNTLQTKTLAMVISAVFAGAIGAVFAYRVGIIDPTTAFGLESGLTPVVMAILGGTGVYYGPVLGVVILMVVQEILWVKLAYLHLLIYGLALIFTGLFMTGGISRSRRFRSLLRLRR